MNFEKNKKQKVAKNIISIKRGTKKKKAKRKKQETKHISRIDLRNSKNSRIVEQTLEKLNNKLNLY